MLNTFFTPRFLNLLIPIGVISLIGLYGVIIGYYLYQKAAWRAEQGRWPYDVHLDNQHSELSVSLNPFLSGQSFLAPLETLFQRQGIRQIEIILTPMVQRHMIMQPDDSGQPYLYLSYAAYQEDETAFLWLHVDPDFFHYSPSSATRLSRELDLLLLRALVALEEADTRRIDARALEVYAQVSDRERGFLLGQPL